MQTVNENESKIGKKLKFKYQHEPKWLNGNEKCSELMVPFVIDHVEQ